MNIGNEIKYIRKRCLMTQTELAEAIGVSFATVNRWENNKSTPNFKALRKIKSICENNNIEFNITITEDSREDNDECN